MNFKDLRPKDGNKIESCVIFLHGYGASGSDLISIGQHWQKNLPNTYFIAPDAPFPFEGGPIGRQWFSLSDMSIDFLQQGLQETRPILEKWIEDLKSAHELNEKNLACVGFSQGTMVSLSYALNHSKELAGVLGYSGVYVPSREKARTKPPVTLIHGDADDVLPLNYYHLSQQALKSEGINVQGYIRPGLGHGIDDWGLEKGCEIVKDWFTKSLEAHDRKGR